MKSRCPVCHKMVKTPGQETREETKFFPFCSERCKLVDLGAWLDVRYRITTETQPNESEEPSETTALSLEGQ